jgi:hypothetical protein
VKVCSPFGLRIGGSGLKSACPRPVIPNEGCEVSASKTLEDWRQSLPRPRSSPSTMGFHIGWDRHLCVDRHRRGRPRQARGGRLLGSKGVWMLLVGQDADDDTPIAAAIRRRPSPAQWCRRCHTPRGLGEGRVGGIGNVRCPTRRCHCRPRALLVPGRFFDYPIMIISELMRWRHKRELE